MKIPKVKSMSFNSIIAVRKYASMYPKKFGTMLALIGVIFLTPDTMIMRLSNLDRWPLMGWRGVLMGITLLILWRYLLKKNVKNEIKSLYSLPGLLVIFAFAINSITFTLGIQETSVMVVLTALATMPIFAALLSSILMKESQGFLGWITICCAMIGVMVVVSDGPNAIGQPDGSTILGATYGAITALGLAFTFTMARKYKELGIIPAAAIGSLISGLIGFYYSSYDEIFSAPVWAICTMGIIILPMSFACLSIAPRFTSSAIVSLIMLLEMVIGPFWVWLGIGERPTITMIFGALLVLIILTFHIYRTQFIEG